MGKQIEIVVKLDEAQLSKIGAVLAAQLSRTQTVDEDETETEEMETSTDDDDEETETESEDSDDSTDEDEEEEAPRAAKSRGKEPQITDVQAALKAYTKKRGGTEKARIKALEILEKVGGSATVKKLKPAKYGRVIAALA